MGCEGSKTADALIPASHHAIGDVFGGWETASEECQRHIASPDADSFALDFALDKIQAAATQPTFVALRDGLGGPAMASIPETESGVFEVAVCVGEDAAACQGMLQESDVLDGLMEMPNPHVAASREVIASADASDVGPDAALIPVLQNTPMLPGVELMSAKAQKTLSNTPTHCPDASQHFWQFMCSGNVAMLVEDVVLFCGQKQKDSKSESHVSSAVQFPVFACTPHCRRQCSAGSEAEINTECGMHKSVH